MGYSEGHWTKDVDGSVDKKTHLVPTSKAEKETLLKQKVTGHLRFPCDFRPSSRCPARRCFPGPFPAPRPLPPRPPAPR